MSPEVVISSLGVKAQYNPNTLRPVLSLSKLLKIPSLQFHFYKIRQIAWYCSSCNTLFKRFTSKNSWKKRATGQKTCDRIKPFIIDEHIGIGAPSTTQKRCCFLFNSCFKITRPSCCVSKTNIPPILSVYNDFIIYVSAFPISAFVTSSLCSGKNLIQTPQSELIFLGTGTTLCGT